MILTTLCSTQEDYVLVVVVMYPPHDGSVSIIATEILRQVDRMCSPQNPHLSIRTRYVWKIVNASNTFREWHSG